MKNNRGNRRAQYDQQRPMKRPRMDDEHEQRMPIKKQRNMQPQRGGYQGMHKRNMQPQRGGYQGLHKPNMQSQRGGYQGMHKPNMQSQRGGYQGIHKPNMQPQRDGYSGMRKQNMQSQRGGYQGMHKPKMQLKFDESSDEDEEEEFTDEEMEDEEFEDEEEEEEKKELHQKVVAEKQKPKSIDEQKNREKVTKEKQTKNEEQKKREKLAKEISPKKIDERIDRGTLLQVAAEEQRRIDERNSRSLFLRSDILVDMTPGEIKALHPDALSVRPNGKVCFIMFASEAAAEKAYNALSKKKMLSEKELHVDYCGKKSKKQSDGGKKTKKDVVPQINPLELAVLHVPASITAEQMKVVFPNAVDIVIKDQKGGNLKGRMKRNTAVVKFADEAVARKAWEKCGKPMLKIGGEPVDVFYKRK